MSADDPQPITAEEYKKIRRNPATEPAFIGDAQLVGVYTPTPENKPAYVLVCPPDDQNTQEHYLLVNQITGENWLKDTQFRALAQYHSQNNPVDDEAARRNRQDLERLQNNQLRNGMDISSYWCRR